MNWILAELLKTGITVIVVILALKFAVGIYVTHEVNMYPAIKDGDFLLTYKLVNYNIGDAVVYVNDTIKNAAPDMFSGFKTGRIVAGPGDKVEIDAEKGYLINGAVPYETVYSETLPAENGNVSYPVTLGEGEYFLLNDDRENAMDSRTYGRVYIEDLRGKCVFIMRHRGI